MTPRSSCPGEEYHSSPGRKPPAHYRINTVAENCAGGELAATSPGQARRGRGSATDCLGHFWQADLGHFSRAPKLIDCLLKETDRKIHVLGVVRVKLAPECLKVEIEGLLDVGISLGETLVGFGRPAQANKLRNAPECTLFDAYEIPECRLDINSPLVRRIDCIYQSRRYMQAPRRLLDGPLY